LSKRVKDPDWNCPKWPGLICHHGMMKARPSGTD
jgi:hypothetical protein